MALPYTVNPIQQNNNKEKEIIDKIDKTPEVSSEQIKHNILTKEIIRRNYISEDDEYDWLNDEEEDLDLSIEKDDF